MKNDGFLPGLVIGAIVGVIVFALVMGNSWKRAAVDHNCAHYDAKTSEFTWNEEENINSGNSN